MGKKKQQKQYRLNHKKEDPNKEQMIDIMKELAEMKHQTATSTIPRTRPTSTLVSSRKRLKKKKNNRSISWKPVKKKKGRRK